MKITLDLTVEEWSELVNAVASKAATLRLTGLETDDDEAWVRVLDGIYKKIATLLERRHVSY